jgi:hypothetical protein
MLIPSTSSSILHHPTTTMVRLLGVHLGTFLVRKALHRLGRILTCAPRFSKLISSTSCSPEPKAVWEEYDGVWVLECPHGGMVKANDTAPMPPTLPEIIHFDMNREERACHERLNALIILSDIDRETRELIEHHLLRRVLGRRRGCALARRED